MSAHTPGPWSVGGKYMHKTVLLNASGESIANGGNNRAVQGEVLEASLILAAAAPKLLEAGRRAEAFIAGFDDDNKSDDVAGILRDLRAAIASATGAQS